MANQSEKFGLRPYKSLNVLRGTMLRIGILLQPIMEQLFSKVTW